MYNSLFRLLSHFSNFTNEQQQLLMQYWKPCHIKKGDYFLKIGQHCSRIAFVIDGIMRTGAMNENNEEYTCSFILKDYIITDTDAYLGRTVTNSNFQCMTNCDLLVLEYADEQKLAEAFPDWLVIREKVTVYMMQIFLNCHAILVHQNATERYVKFVEQFPEVMQNVPLSHVASYLGIAQPSLSRIRKELLA